MDILYLLIPLSLVLVFVIGVIFWWSLRSGQFEDLEGPGYRVLMDDDSAASAEKCKMVDSGQDVDPAKRG